MIGFTRPQVHDDDRRRAVNDLFQLPANAGQLNISHIYPGVTVAWHRHKKQTDYWYCVKGSIKVGLYHDGLGKLQWEYLHEGERRVLAIPPGVWHGYKNISKDESVLLYWVTEKYNKEQPDEERCHIGLFGDCWDAPVR
jgi:dTDP-4-dehydrorhamnose 3,5-epimerase